MGINGLGSVFRSAWNGVSHAPQNFVRNIAEMPTRDKLFGGALLAFTGFMLLEFTHNAGPLNLLPEQDPGGAMWRHGGG